MASESQQMSVGSPTSPIHQNLSILSQPSSVPPNDHVKTKNVLFN